MSEELFQPAPHVLAGDTADIYFLRAHRVMEAEGVNPTAAMEIFPHRDGLICGMREVGALLGKALPQGAEVWGLEDGEPISAHEVVLRVKAQYLSYAVYETAILGILAQESGWAQAAQECVEAAEGVPVVSFGARHVHPLVAPYMDYAAIVGGCASASTTPGAAMAGKEPSGTMPHAMIICFGDTVKAAVAFDKHVEPEVPRIVLVDTFLDEPQEALRVAETLGERLQGVRLDTPGERGGVTPERIRQFLATGASVDGFGVGSYITSAQPNDFTADLKEVEGKPIAKRGRIPGVTDNPRLKRLI